MIVTRCGAAKRRAKRTAHPETHGRRSLRLVQRHWKLRRVVRLLMHTARLICRVAPPEAAETQRVGACDGGHQKHARTG